MRWRYLSVDVVVRPRLNVGKPTAVVAVAAGGAAGRVRARVRADARGKRTGGRPGDRGRARRAPEPPSDPTPVPESRADSGTAAAARTCAVPGTGGVDARAVAGDPSRRPPRWTHRQQPADARRRRACRPALLRAGGHDLHTGSAGAGRTTTELSDPAAGPTTAPLGWDVYDDALLAETFDGDGGTGGVRRRRARACSAGSAPWGTIASAGRARQAPATRTPRPARSPMSAGGSGPGGSGPGQGPSLGLFGAAGGSGAGMALLTLLGHGVRLAAAGAPAEESFPHIDGHVAAVGVRPSDRSPGLVRLPAD